MRRPFHLQTVSFTLRRDHDRRQRPVSVSQVSSLSRFVASRRNGRIAVPEVSASAVSLPMGRGSHLQAASSTLQGGRVLAGRRTVVSGSDVRSRARVVGSSNGCFALAVDHSRGSFLSCWTRRIFILDPRAGKEVQLTTPTGTLDGVSSPCREYVRKLVFPPGPDDGTVVALYDRKFIACIDIATSRDKWTTIDVLAGDTTYLADIAFGADGKLYCVDSNGGVEVVCIPRRGHTEFEPPSTLLSKSNHYSYLNPAGAFPPPFDIASSRMNTKHIFFCNGSLHQVWRNNSATINSGGLSMLVDEILVLRYYPGRWPCWDAVKDLGGCSVFIDKSNSPAVVQAAGVPGVRADCVYWIDWMRVPMVSDIATGTSKPYVLPYGRCKGNCWYFGHDDMTGINGDGRN